MGNQYEAYEMIDKIMSQDLSLRGAISKLYDASRALTGEAPLSYAAARALIENIRPGDTVFFLTGLLVRSAFTADIAESDGPIGIAVLAHTMQEALGITPILIADDTMQKPLEQVMRAGGFSRVPPEKAAAACAPSKRPTRAFAIVTMPSVKEEAEREAVRLLTEYQPSAVISCERGGPNEFGVTHNSQGKDISFGHCRSDLLFKAGYEMEGGPVTIGIGDGGNEVGMGNIRESLLQWLPHGDKCECGCGGGIIPETKCDVLIASTVSNWGASALASAIVLMSRKEKAVSDTGYHKKIIEATAAAGFIDSPTGEAVPRIDGMDMALHLAVAEELDQIVRTVLGGNSSMWERK